MSNMFAAMMAYLKSQDDKHKSFSMMHDSPDSIDGFLAHIQRKYHGRHKAVHHRKGIRGRV